MAKSLFLIILLVFILSACTPKTKVETNNSREIKKTTTNNYTLCNYRNYITNIRSQRLEQAGNPIIEDNVWPGEVLVIVKGNQKVKDIRDTFNKYGIKPEDVCAVGEENTQVLVDETKDIGDSLLILTIIVPFSQEDSLVKKLEVEPVFSSVSLNYIASIQ